MPKFKGYLIGFLLSLVLTLAAYFVVTNHVLTGGLLIGAIIALAFIQLTVQLIFFLHLASGRSSLANVNIFLTTMSIIFIIVVGSLWIMNHLNYNMTPDQMNNFVQSQEAIQK